MNLKKFNGRKIFIYIDERERERTCTHQDLPASPSLSGENQSGHTSGTAAR